MKLAPDFRSGLFLTALNGLMMPMMDARWALILVSVGFGMGVAGLVWFAVCRDAIELSEKIMKENDRLARGLLTTKDGVWRRVEDEEA